MNPAPRRSRLRRHAALWLAAACMVSSAWAAPFVVRDIRIEGLQRVEPGTVFASLPVRIGDTYTDDSGSASIRALFSLGLFKDVRIEVDGNVLVVIVEERPTVANVDFTGTREFDKDSLKKALREIGIVEGRPFDQALADRAEQELKRQYINRSLYGVEVVTTVTPIERNRVNLSFSVVEGGPARIREIRIVGARAFSESTLRGQFELDTGGWLSWYTKSDRYSRAKLNADLEALRSYYLTRGFLEFRIDSTQVAISPDKQDITVTINITEGARFAVSSVKLEGNYLGKDDEFKARVKIRPGEAYNAEQVAETTKAFQDLFGTLGYAFAQVESRPEVDRATNRVTLVLQAEPSRRVYVRRIQVTGNSRTRDEVIRREFRQFEAAWYDAERIKRSRDRVDRLGFFKEVNVETSEVAGAELRHQAGKRLWLGKLPRRGGQHQQVQPHAGVHHRRPVLHPGRHLAHGGPVPPQLAALQRPGRQLRAHHQRREPALWRALHRGGHGVLRGRPGAHPDQAGHQHPGHLPDLRRPLWLHQLRHADLGGLGAR
jgi:outer membrane protein insertion porin family